MCVFVALHKHLIIAHISPSVVQPLKCLCGSALCRGFIGGKEVANRMADPRSEPKKACCMFASFTICFTPQ